ATPHVSRHSSTTAIDPTLKTMPNAPTTQKVRVSPPSARESFAIVMILSLGFLILALGFFSFFVGAQQRSVDGSGPSCKSEGESDEGDPTSAAELLVQPVTDG